MDIDQAAPSIEAPIREQSWPEVVSRAPTQAAAMERAAAQLHMPPLRASAPAEVPQESATVADIDRVVNKWKQAIKRDSRLALKDLEALQALDVDTEECEDALQEYRDLERADYDSPEEYQEARDEAWDAFIESLGSLEPPEVPPVRGAEPAPDLSKYPASLTMQEYERKWKPRGWNIIFIGPTSTWRQEWGTWEAIRDLVQNALDETETYRFGYDDLGLYIADDGKGVGISNFLLGPPKLKPDWARGKFGEGMKIASLALVRLGYPVYVQTVDREIHVLFLEQEADGKVLSLAALWRPGGTQSGTTFHIVGYKGEAYADRFVQNLPREWILKSAPSPLAQPVQRYNQLLRGEFPGGKQRIYVRDIYMRDIDSPFSYNLWGFALSPDRFGPKNERDMYADMGRLWACVDDVQLLVTFLRMAADPPLLKSEEGYQVQMGSWDMGSHAPDAQGHQAPYSDDIVQNAERWHAAWKEAFGEQSVLRTSPRWDAMVAHLGYQSVSLTWSVRDALRTVLLDDATLIARSQQRLSAVEIIPDTGLSDRQLASLQVARAIAQKVSSAGPITGVHAAIIPPASDRVRTAGLYSRSLAAIYISPDQLEYGRRAIDVVIHEIAHHNSQAEDGEEGHNQALSTVGANVVHAVAGGQFDPLLQNASFYWG